MPGPVDIELRNLRRRVQTAQAEVDAVEAGLGTASSADTEDFAAASHTHAQSDITNLTTDLAGKQATLVSATNIKTINGNSLLGAGDLVISSGSPWDFDGGTASTTYSVGTIDFEEGAA